MNRSEAYDKIVPAMFRAKALINALPFVKDKRGDKAKYLQLSTLLAGVEPILLAEDLMMTQGTVDKITDGVLVAITVRTTVLHISGQWYAEDLIVPVSGPILKGGESRGPVGAQDGGISTTYARRYGIIALWCVSIDEDTDGANQNQGRRKRAAQIASSIVEKTMERTDALKKGLAQFVNTDEPCTACGQAKGQRHGDGCPNALADRQTTDRPAVGAGVASGGKTTAKADARPAARNRGGRS